MGDISLMAIIESRHYLLEKKFSLSFVHLPIWLGLQVAMQRPSTHKLHNKEDLLVSIESLIELCYSFVIKSLHNFDLSFDTLSSVRLKQLKLFIDFESNLLV